ncbi:hypothetical protein GCM10009851_36680 [Herbiconiux moechotypicola]|uniref:Secreted protein n=1 Tax=Herbiconiux moechotypicola TaxID=637393 RepID=A0ABN3E3T7_9MICO
MRVTSACFDSSFAWAFFTSSHVGYSSAKAGPAPSEKESTTATTLSRAVSSDAGLRPVAPGRGRRRARPAPRFVVLMMDPCRARGRRICVPAERAHARMRIRHICHSACRESNKGPGQMRGHSLACE